MDVPGTRLCRHASTGVSPRCLWLKYHARTLKRHLLDSATSNVLVTECCHSVLSSSSCLSLSHTHWLLARRARLLWYHLLLPLTLSGFKALLILELHLLIPILLIKCSATSKTMARREMVSLCLEFGLVLYSAYPGSTDDTAAINAAITDGTRCGYPTGCASSTLTPALVYFPSGKASHPLVTISNVYTIINAAGTYIVSAPLIAWYYTSSSYTWR